MKLRPGTLTLLRAPSIMAQFNYGAMECIERADKKGFARALSARRVQFPEDDMPLGLRDLS
jgi:hypothetical protein